MLNVNRQWRFIVLEVYRDRLAGGRIFFTQLEKFHLYDMEHICNEIAWKGLDTSIEIAHIAIIKSARSLDLIFGVCKLLLKVEKILICFEFGIRLCYSKKLTERSTVAYFRPGPYSARPVAPIAALRAVEIFSKVDFSWAA